MDKRSILAAVVAAALLTLAAPAAATADVGAGTVRVFDGDVDYTPDKPKEPSLAGSRVDVVCLRDAPWITFEVTLTDPDRQSTGDRAVLVISDGTHEVSLPLGTLASGRVAGSVLWPGAAVSGGVGTGWPGWVYEGGQWRETAGNFAWTRGDVRAWIRVNPELAVPLAYPPATSGCAAPTGSIQGRLAATGTSGDILLPLVLAGAGAAAVGLVVVLSVRRRHRV